MDDPRQTREQVTLGVDTHAELHVAAALDERGRLLGTCTIATTAAGFAELVGWYRLVGDGQFWRRVAPRFGLPVEMPYNDERLVLYPNLARNE